MGCMHSQRLGSQEKLSKEEIFKDAAESSDIILVVNMLQTLLSRPLRVHCLQWFWENALEASRVASPHQPYDLTLTSTRSAARRAFQHWHVVAWQYPRLPLGVPLSSPSRQRRVIRGSFWLAW